MHSTNSPLLRTASTAPLRALAAARTTGARLLDALLPPQCIRCTKAVDKTGNLCGDCWTRMTFMAPPWCARCGFPFTYPGLSASSGDESLCAACISRAPAYDRARAVFVYDDESRDLVLRFKHADRVEAAPALARWMHRAGQDIVANAEAIVPVPLHRWRLWRRRYNQAALLARALARLAPGEFAPNLLQRRRYTRSQGGLSGPARRRNVAGAFEVRENRIRDIRDRRILLVDDVFTTGATAEACARALKRSGAAQVDVLTVARVVRPGSVPI